MFRKKNELLLQYAVYTPLLFFVLTVGCKQPPFHAKDDSRDASLNPVANSKNSLTTTQPPGELSLLEQAKALAFNQGDIDQARTMVERVIMDQSYPFTQRVDATKMLMDMLLKEERREEAIQLYESISTTVDMDLAMSKEFESFKKIEKAFKVLMTGHEHLCNLKPTPPETHHGIVGELARNIPCVGIEPIWGVGDVSVYDAFMDPIKQVHVFLCDTVKDNGDPQRAWGIAEMVYVVPWYHIPIWRDDFKKTLTMYIHDATVAPIPERYSDLLPYDYSKMTAQIEDGKGLVVIDLNGIQSRFLIAAENLTALHHTVRKFQALEHLPVDGVFIADLHDA
ncbi:MAG: hypothetical protein QNJ97_05805 [Myxococcota bacterium]|nr:hypothetical protein [Myxococcota bacterium]